MRHHFSYIYNNRNRKRSKTEASQSPDRYKNNDVSQELSRRGDSNVTSPQFFTTGGWSGDAMVLGKLPVPGRPTIWMKVGQGPIALAVGAGGGCLDIFTLLYPFSPLSPSLWETARYRLKYCLKGPLNPKQPTNQPSLQQQKHSPPTKTEASQSLDWHRHNDVSLEPPRRGDSSETSVIYNNEKRFFDPRQNQARVRTGTIVIMISPYSRVVEATQARHK